MALLTPTEFPRSVEIPTPETKVSDITKKDGRPKLVWFGQQYSNGHTFVSGDFSDYPFFNGQECSFCKIPHQAGRGAGRDRNSSMGGIRNALAVIRNCRNIGVGSAYSFYNRYYKCGSKERKRATRGRPIFKVCKFLEVL